MKQIILLFLCLVFSLHLQAQKFEQLAMTPPMGWNSWNKFAGNINEEIIRKAADNMVSSGMKDAGYEYIVIDDCWQVSRDSLGFIVPDPKSFPSGIKALADYVHSKGLKFGIYSCAGTKTCAGRPGSKGYETQDATMYARWGVDYLKFDWCNTDGQNAQQSYTTMRDALYKAGRPIVFSICEWGNNKPWIWGPAIGHLWRTTGDIYNCFDCVQNHGTWSSWGVLSILDKQDGLRQYAGPGHWNDPDMLEVGNGMVANEDRAHFSMWCMLAAPLIAGNDMSKMSPQTKEILTNKEAIAVNQDALGVQGFRHAVSDSLETWLKPLSNGDWAICFLNRAKTVRKVTFDWKTQIIFDPLSKRTLNAGTTVYSLRNLWTKTGAGNTGKALTATVPAHDVLMLRLTATK